MDFGALPPEINSGRMYAGSGAGPMLAAAAAWSGLGAELGTTASSYESVISMLTGEEWLGPASAAMAAAAAPYVAWMNTTAAAAEHAAVQAMASAAAYETAFAMTVPPPVIAANRAQLAALVATNVLGQNTPAIAANEALYGEMWTQDAAAMYGYAASSAGAATLTPLTSPAQNTNPAGLAGQAAAVTQAAGSSAGTQTGLPQLVSTLPTTMQGLAAPVAASGSSSSGLSSIWDGLNSLFGNGFVSSAANEAGNVGAWNLFAGLATSIGLAKAGPAALSATSTIGSTSPAGLAGGLGGGILAGAVAPAGSAGFGGAPVLAGLGQASSVGGLSVPASWSAATPETTAGAATLTGSGWTAAEDTPMATVPAGMPAFATAGRGGFGFGPPRYGIKPIVMPRSVVIG